MLTERQFERSDKLSAEQVKSLIHALELVVSSDAFAGSKRCQDFLRLTVKHAVAGELDCLRERMIGAEMFGRPVDYDTSNDAVVRVRATEVRKRLSQYYSEAAQTPVVRIELPSGSYVPEFHWSSPIDLDGRRCHSSSSCRFLHALGALQHCSLPACWACSAWFS